MVSENKPEAVRTCFGHAPRLPLQTTLRRFWRISCRGQTHDDAIEMSYDYWRRRSFGRRAIVEI